MLIVVLFLFRVIRLSAGLSETREMIDQRWTRVGYIPKYSSQLHKRQLRRTGIAPIPSSIINMSGLLIWRKMQNRNEDHERALMKASNLSCLLSDVSRDILAQWSEHFQI